MTLREYILSRSKKHENELFDNDYQAVFAESWDAETFGLYFFKKNIKDVSLSNILKVAKAACGLEDEYYDEDFEENNFIIDDNKIMIGDGSYKKLAINYDPDTLEPFVENDKYKRLSLLYYGNNSDLNNSDDEDSE